MDETFGACAVEGREIPFFNTGTPLDSELGKLSPVSSARVYTTASIIAMATAIRTNNPTKNRSTRLLFHCALWLEPEALQGIDVLLIVLAYQIQHHW